MAIDSELIYDKMVDMKLLNSHSAHPELAIWERVFIPENRQLTPEQSRYLLNVKFSASDLDRINALSEKADAGTITAQDRAELEQFIHVGHLLSILKAKIRGQRHSQN